MKSSSSFFVVRPALRRYSVGAGLLILLLGPLCGSCVRPFICTSKAKYHAVFSADTQPPINPAATIKTVRVFIGADGELYPNELLVNSVGLRDYSDCLLRNYYCASIHQGELAALATRCGITSSLPFAAKWAMIQDSLIAQKAREIDSATALAMPGPPGSRHGTLLVLIHGYNEGEEEHGRETRCADDPDRRLTPRPYYATLRKALEPYWKEHPPTAVLEVYWDGLKKKYPVGIWGKGQVNARSTGLCLRQVLCNTNATTPVRILTHSSGGIVATHIFWNVRKPYPKDHTHFLTLYKNNETPTHTDVRLGMLVPAMPGIAFNDFRDRTPQVAAAATDLPPQRVIIGANANDYAVTKFGFAPGKFGASNLGCVTGQFAYVQQACPGTSFLISFAQWNKKNSTRKQLDYTAGITEAEAAPFRRGHSKLEQHSWHLYLQRRQFAAFAQQLFN